MHRRAPFMGFIMSGNLGNRLERLEREIEPRIAFVWGERGWPEDQWRKEIAARVDAGLMSPDDNVVRIFWKQ